MLLRPFLISLLIMLPWLTPFAAGPSPTIMPWLISVLATAGLMICSLLPSAPNAPSGGAGFPTRWPVRVILFCAVGWRCSRLLLGARVRASSIATAWLMAGVLSCCISLLQYFGATAVFEPWVNQAPLGEAFANLRQRNQFATLTNIALVSLIWFAVEAMTIRTQWRWNWLAVLLAGLLAAGNAASQSRTGVTQIGLIYAMCALWGLWRNVMVGRILGTSLICYVLAAVLLPMLLGFDLSIFGMAARLSAGDAPCTSRITLWSNVLHLIAQKPWLGWGWGELDYAHFITLYNEPRFCDILDNAHNLPLHLAVELGVPAAVLICGGFMWWAVRQKPWAESDATRQMAWAVMALILLHSMLEYPLWYGPFQMAFGACVLLLWRQKRPSEIKNSSKKASNWSLTHVLWTQVAIILIAFVGYAAWDYRRVSQIYLPPESRAAAYRTDTLNKIRSSWLFANQVEFAELLTTPLTPVNAVWTFNTARHLLHYSPEPRVIEKLIESAVMLSKDDDALAYLARFRAAFPVEHIRWEKANQSTLKKPP